ncbi:MAG TPA: class I tRNA ligase family protein, partial [Candidatus Dormibacteraeota bacterium]|nr:class I tRNA ligase family protein [Candidatus Dormibacteraeota bacterium]
MEGDKLGLRIRDTLTGNLLPVPIGRGGEGEPLLRLYVCGVTPYDSGHMGHASTFASFDILVRYLEAQGVTVRYVQNVTDVDDPLFERANRDGLDWLVLARAEQASFVDDMASIGWRAPDAMPRVSEEIPQILTAISELAAAGFTYQTLEGTFFGVSRYPSFGFLSKRSRRSMLAKLRSEGLLGKVGEGHKHDPLDFPLWRPSGPGEPAWPSPFGEGRPGWHIECSAMARHHLGEQVEIHGGGRDLIYSHHESERAQSESITGQPFAKVWMHTGMVRLGGTKMSKSLGNLVVVKEALRKASPAALRLYLASHHYSSDWEFSWEGLERAGRWAKSAADLVAGRQFPA